MIVGEEKQKIIIHLVSRLAYCCWK